MYKKDIDGNNGGEKMENVMENHGQATSSSSNVEIKALLTYFLNEAQKSLGRTEIMKYVYSFEYYFYQMFGKQFTNLEFNRYYYGPNESMVMDAVSELSQEGIIQITEYENYYGEHSYNHKLVMEPNDEAYDLPDPVKFVASFIVDSLGNENYKGVINFAYSTPPMKEILKEEELIGRPLLGRVLDMSKTGPIFKSTREEKAEARRRLKATQKERGSDEEYYSNLLNQYHLFEDTRRRALDAASDLPE